MPRLLPLAALLLAVGCSKPAAWRELPLTEAGLALEMPAEWREGQLGEGRKYEAKHAAAEYVVAVQPVPAGTPARDALRQSRGDVAKWLPGGRVASERAADIGDLPGEILELEADGGASARVKTVVSRGRLVSLVVAYKGAAKSPGDALRFIESLKPPASAGAAGPGPSAEAKPTEPVPDRRSAWRYDDAPPVFADQAASSGVIRKRGKGWVDEVAGGKANEFAEVARTPEYVELKRPGAEFRVRLYADKSEYTMGGGKWMPMYPGRWEGN